MSRIRTIKPEILEDDKTAALSDTSYRLFTAMIVLADDHGNLRANEQWLAGQVWWAHRNPPKVAASLRELVLAQLIEMYEVTGQLYAHIRSWTKHQRIDNAGKPRVPPPSEDSRKSAEEFCESPPNAALPPTSDLRPPTIAARSARGTSPQAKSEHRQAVDYFHQRFLEATGTPPTWGGTQGKWVKELLAAHGLEIFKQRVDLLFDSPPDWIGTRDLGTLRQHFDKLVTVAPKPTERVRLIPVLGAVGGEP